MGCGEAKLARGHWTGAGYAGKQQDQRKQLINMRGGGERTPQDEQVIMDFTFYSAKQCRPSGFKQRHQCSVTIYTTCNVSSGALVLGHRPRHLVRSASTSGLTKTLHLALCSHCLAACAHAGLTASFVNSTNFDAGDTVFALVKDAPHLVCPEILYPKQGCVFHVSVRSHCFCGILIPDN